MPVSFPVKLETKIKQGKVMKQKKYQVPPGHQFDYHGVNKLFELRRKKKSEFIAIYNGGCTYEFLRLVLRNQYLNSYNEITAPAGFIEKLAKFLDVPPSALFEPIPREGNMQPANK